MEVEVIEQCLGIEFGRAELVGALGKAQLTAVDAVAQGLGRETIDGQHGARTPVGQGDREVAAHLGQRAAGLGAAESLSPCVDVASDIGRAQQQWRRQGVGHRVTGGPALGRILAAASCRRWRRTV